MTAAGDLLIEGMSVRYGKAQALSNVTLIAPAGKVTAIAGPNGAGKSSLLLATYGSVASSGTVKLNGEDQSSIPARRRAKRVAIVPQGRQLFATMSVRENLQIMADMLHLPASAVDEAQNRFPVLAERSKNLAGVLSGGEQQMLVVARALMGKPEALLLDETMTGLAPLIVKQISDVVRELADQGVAVLVAEPSVRALHKIIDRGYVLIRGEIVTSADSGAELDKLLERHMGIESRDALEESGQSPVE